MNNIQLWVVLGFVAISVIQAIVKAMKEQAAKKQAEERKLRQQDESLRQGPSTRREQQQARGDEMIAIPGQPQTQAGGDPLADLLRRLPGGTPGTTVPMPAPARKEKKSELDRAREVGERRRAAETQRQTDVRDASASQRASRTQSMPKPVSQQPMATRAQSNLPREARPVPMPQRVSQQREQQQREQSRAQARPQNRGQVRPPQNPRSTPLVTEEQLEERRQHERQKQLASAKAEGVQQSVSRGALVGGTRMTPREWRRAIIAREILQPPLALRDE